jgi:RNA polymerase sigma-70 factor, ECF subfamily
MVAELRQETFVVDPPDPELVERVRSGENDAFELLIERHQKRLYRVILAILRDESKADAVTHDTFVQAYLKLDRFEGRSEFRTWLTRIGINRARDELRGRKWLSFRFGHDEDDENVLPFEVVDPAPDAERMVLSTEMQETIDQAVETLSSQQKTIFRLRHFEELPLEEIASMLGLKSGTVRAHLFRAVHKVRDALRSAGFIAGEVSDDEALQ